MEQQWRKAFKGPKGVGEGEGGRVRTEGHGKFPGKVMEIVNYNSVYCSIQLGKSFK